MRDNASSANGSTHRLRATVHTKSRFVGRNNRRPVFWPDETTANISATLKALTCHIRHYSSAHGVGIKAGWHQTAAHILMSALCPLRSLLVIDSLVAAHEADSLWMLFLDILSHEAKLSAIIAIVLIAVDRLSIVGLADFLNVMLKTPVGKEPARSLSRSCRARKRTSTHRNICKELSNLERISTLLQELLVTSRKIGLLCLLLDLSRSHLSLSPLKPSLLSRSAKTGDLLRPLHTTSKILSNNTLLLLSCAETRLISLLIDGGQSLPHPKLLLTAQNVALSLISAATKSAAANCFSLLLRQLLTLLLLQSRLRWSKCGKHCRVLIVSNLIFCERTDILRTRKS